MKILGSRSPFLSFLILAKPIKMKTLVLLGYGKMARALALGLKEKANIQVAGRNPQKIREFCDDLGLTPLSQNNNLIEVQDQEILLCVKPYALQSFQFVGKAKCVYSFECVNIFFGFKADFFSVVKAEVVPFTNER